MGRITAINRILFLSLALVPLFSTLQFSVAHALSDTDVQSIYSDTVWYKPGLGSLGLCAPTDGSVGATLPPNVPEPYNALLSQAAAAFYMNPQFLAAIFLSENSNVWKSFDTNWQTSPAGAMGPFQFMPLTWYSYKTDGDNDGATDINNVYDAAYSAAKLLGSYAGLAAPLGSLDTPFKPNTILVAAAAYNWGPGNIQKNTTPSSSITGGGKVPVETQNYIRNVYALITSGFTKSGNPGYGDPGSTLGPGSGGSSTPLSASGCSGGVVAGSVAQTAINLSWPSSHNPKLEPRPEYITALQDHNPSVASSGADCGVFVATVMRASGADPDYPPSGTAEQERHVRSLPDKYQVIQLSASDTTDIFQPGDILIVNANGGQGANGHTMIIVGNQPGGNEASASLDTRMPNLGTISSVSDDQDRGYYVLARLK